VRLADLGKALDARAAGAWRVEGEDLVQVEFWAAPDMEAMVAEGFALATRCVPLSRVDLGIVGAAIEARPRTSIARELPGDSGSGLWLRRFAADRSVAVPWVIDGVTVAVGSVALRDAREADAIRMLEAFLALDGRPSGVQNGT
jgi:hypothetical protein